MSDFLNGLKSDFADFAKSRIGWFFAGAFLTHADIPTVVASLKQFLGIG